MYKEKGAVQKQMRGRVSAEHMKEHLKTECICRPVPCPLKCGFDVAFKNVIKHVESECEARMLKCSQGCGKEMKSKELENHEQHECPYRLVNCGNGCGERLKLSDLEEHKKTSCGKRMIVCTHCPKEMFADKLEWHLQNKCKKAPMFCRFGCGETVIRGKMKTHEKRHCPMRITECSLGCGVQLREKDRIYHETKFAFVSIAPKHLENQEASVERKVRRNLDIQDWSLVVQQYPPARMAPTGNLLCPRHLKYWRREATKYTNVYASLISRKHAFGGRNSGKSRLSKTAGNGLRDTARGI